MRAKLPTMLFLLALLFSPGFVAAASAADYVGAISAYRRAHGLPAVVRTTVLRRLRSSRRV